MFITFMLKTKKLEPGFTWLTLSPSGGDPFTDLTDAANPCDKTTQSTTTINLPSILRDDSYTKSYKWRKHVTK